MTGSAEPAAGAARATIFVRGRVQGVGFRWWVRSQALELGLAGHAANLYDGRVEVVAQGSGSAVSELISRLEEFPSSRHRPGQVRAVVVQYAAPLPGVTGFSER